MAEAAVNSVGTDGRPHAGASSPSHRGGGRAKRVLDAIADIIVFPLLLMYRVGVRLVPSRSEMLFQSYSQFLALRPGISGIFLRRAFYRRTLTRCSRESSIGFGTTFATPEVEIGEGVSISTYCNIGHATIGDDAMIGSNVHILSGSHQHNFDRLDVPIRHQGGRFTRVNIGRDVWVGNHAIVLHDVGDQAIVAAAAVVSRSVPSRSIVAGNPARIVRERGAPGDGEPATGAQT